MNFKQYFEFSKVVKEPLIIKEVGIPLVVKEIELVILSFILSGLPNITANCCAPIVSIIKEAVYYKVILDVFLAIYSPEVASKLLEGSVTAI